MMGVQVLAQSSAPVARACALLAAQTLECALKSYLSHKGVPESVLKERPLRHDLEALWKEAVDQGAPLTSQFKWLGLLNTLHNTPYRGRYPTKQGGLVSPPRKPVASELQGIVASIGAVVRPR
jgi:HEPN domain-containing protein